MKDESEKGLAWDVAAVTEVKVAKTTAGVYGE
jgi:hypothetical protein